MSSVNPTPPVFSSGPLARKRKDIVYILLLFIAVLVGLAGLAFATGWRESMTHISKLTLIEMLLLLGLSFVNYVFRAMRWHLFSTTLGIGVHLKQSMRHYFGGFAMTVTPGRVGELVRMRWLRRETGWPFEKTAPLMLVDRASDLAALALLLALALAFSGSGIFGAFPVVIAALLVALVSTRPALVVLVADVGYRFFKRWPRLFARIRSSARSLGKFSRPGVLLITTSMGVLGWFAEVYAFYLLLGWMGADIHLTTAAAIFVFSTIAGNLTGAPGGVGGAEAAMVALLALEGVPLEISLPATAVIRITTLWFAIGIGLVAFPIAEKQSKRAADALE